MDVATIALFIGLGSLLVERFFSWANRIKKSCLGGELIRVKNFSSRIITTRHKLARIN